MKNTLFFFLFLFVVFGSLRAESFPSLQFRTLSVADGLASNDVNQVYQDKDGFVWIATTRGLCRYDGYSVQTFKSNLYTPGLLNNNDTYCLAEDDNHQIWIGTYDGLNVLNKQNGRIRSACEGQLAGRLISCMLSFSPDTLLLGMENGLYIYCISSDTCELFLPGRLPRGSVKSLLRDSHNNVWVGTWSSGFFRYDPEKDEVLTCPAMGGASAALAVFEDSQGQVWIGTWNQGLYRIKNPYDNPQDWEISSYRYDRDCSTSLRSDYVYSISEDLNTRTIWVATRNGLSVLLDEAGGKFSNYVPDGSSGTVSYNVVTSLMRDDEGIIWVGMQGGGVNTVITHSSDFMLDRLEQVKHEYIYSHLIRTLIVDRNGLLWIGFDTYGFIVYDRRTGQYTYNLDSKDFRGLGRLPTINTIYQSSATGRIWIGTYDWGVVLYDPSLPEGKRGRLLDRTNAPWLCHQRILSIMEDRRGNTWFGTRGGICVLKSDLEAGFRLDTCRVGKRRLADYSFTAIAEDSTGAVWTGTTNGGIVRICGNPENPSDLRFVEYAPSNGKLNTTNVLCVFIDSRQRVWAGTEGGGLNLFDPLRDTFEPVHRRMQLPGDAIYSIQEDKQKNLWMATNEGLIRLTTGAFSDSATYRLYTVADGLLNSPYSQNAAFTDFNGEMFFSGQNGFNSFFPDRMTDEESFPPIVLTDIKIHNRSWSAFSLREQAEISSLAPDFTEHCTLNYRRNNFNIEFATLTYANPLQINYAYKLEGFDKEWIHTDASRRFAYYNNLKPGRYTFRLAATNSNGTWNPEERTLQILILPPPWLSGWAYLLYILLTACVVYALVRFSRHRMKLQNALHLAELEQAKIQEINHLKLQFFTNITHELLTPLTVLSAAVEELRLSVPVGREQYQVMTSNINRLIRLLQQILEFRKAETGNLKLRVSRGDLALFVKANVDSFRPLIKKKHMAFTVCCEPDGFDAYFDSDKVDKILYNLLSNAAKYNTPGTTVEITLRAEIGPDRPQAVLQVKDNGNGLSEEEQKNLFKRFYEGNYRRFNTIGTGIGLSLTRDLVCLHHGDIAVESKVGEGTVFRVSLPCNRASYAEEEIDDAATSLLEERTQVKETAAMLRQPVVLDRFVSPDFSGNITESSTGNALENTSENILKPAILSYTLLLIEDNGDLLALLVRLLSTDYRIVTAQTGKEGLKRMEEEEVDLVVSDIMMPEMDGIEFCRQVKGNLQTSHIPLILLTAKSREQDRVAAYEVGADGFISKPFNLSVLHAKINNLLKAKERGMYDFKKQLVFQAQELNYTSLDEDFLQKTIDLIHAHLSDSDLDQQTFLEELGLSKSTFYRKIKSLTGLSLSTFIRNIRLKAACRLMEEKRNMRISEVAYAVGFNDPKYFSSCFKKEFGVQPSEYQERFAQPVDP